MATDLSSLVFAFVEGGTLEIFRNEAAAVVAFEGVDVESGTVAFYDAMGSALEARFKSTNTRWLGFVVGSGVYELRPPAREDAGTFAQALFETRALEANEWFETLDDLRREMRLRGIHVDYVTS